ncbi:MAG: hypothetical protein QME16_00115 [Planctomycetota bacterium]|nr:hypothetical protein [Planctomycetota bacterium]
MPRLQFSTIYTRVESISNVTGQRALIKDSIQMGLDKLTAADLPYLMTEGFIATIAPYETGTVTATNASKTITGSGTTFTAAMVGRKIRMGSENAYYRISAFVSTTEVTLEAAYQGTTEAGKTFSIYKDEYRLPADCDVYKVMRQIENGIALVGIEPTAFDIYEPTPQSKGSPDFEILSGTKLDTYTTGTLSGTVNLSVLTGSSTVWTGVEGLGRGSRITIGSNVYTVKSVDSNTQITIYEKLSVTVSAGTSYTIHLDNYIIQFFPIPDAAENIYFRYQRIPFPLINDEDIPDLPEKYHYILITAGLIWAWMTKDKDEATKQEAMFNAQKQEMWARIGNISRSLSFPRRSQDDIAMNRRRYNLPADYGVPISYNR